MKILYLCTRPEAQNNGGSVVAGRNLCAIRQIVGEESVEVCYLPKPTWKTVGRVFGYIEAVMGWIVPMRMRFWMWRLIIILYLSKVRYWVDL